MKQYRIVFNRRMKAVKYENQSATIPVKANSEEEAIAKAQKRVREIDFTGTLEGTVVSSNIVAEEFEDDGEDE